MGLFGANIASLHFIRIYEYISKKENIHSFDIVKLVEPVVAPNTFKALDSVRLC